MDRVWRDNKFRLPFLDVSTDSMPIFALACVLDHTNERLLLSTPVQSQLGQLRSTEDSERRSTASCNVFLLSVIVKSLASLSLPGK